MPEGDTKHCRMPLNQIILFVANERSMLIFDLHAVVFVSTQSYRKPASWVVGDTLLPPGDCSIIF